MAEEQFRAVQSLSVPVRRQDHTTEESKPGGRRTIPCRRPVIVIASQEGKITQQVTTTIIYFMVAVCEEIGPPLSNGREK